jgi:hypothetical protein
MATMLFEKISQPFFTSKPTREGTWLGLSLSYDIITKIHALALNVESIGESMRSLHCACRNEESYRGRMKLI